VRLLVLHFLLFATSCNLHAADGRISFHGRANFYGGDGQLRIWQIGTHHEYESDNSSWDTVIDWLIAGVKPSERKNYASPASAVYLFADFAICPTEPFKKGSVQVANVKSAVHRHYVRVN